ncbi:MAG: DNA-directed RNA polymerase subunit A' [Methanosarcinales archaeon]
MLNSKASETPKRISKIKFELLSPKEIRKMSVTRIIMPDTYDDSGYPIEMGLMDPRLGVIDPGLRCKICGGKPGECPGHFGSIELQSPVIHVGFAKLIRKILRSTCRECGKLLLTEARKREYKDKIKALHERNSPIDYIVDEMFKEAYKNTVCPYCNSAQGKIKFEKPTDFIEDGNKLLPIDIRERFERIPDEDVEIMGLFGGRPEWTILTVLPVPPVSVRPSITLESGQRSEDDLTHKLVDIIRINQRFQENYEAGAPTLILEDLLELLQYHVTTYFDNTVAGVPPSRHRSGRPLKTLSQRLKGKEGRFRGSLSGKRVNFSARTVISPDPNLSISEVGVPKIIAKELTIPVKVNERNLTLMKSCVRRGPIHPGANYVIKKEGERVKVLLKNCKELSEELEVGDTVERHIVDGDIVLFNRQPSLHKMSIMAHRVVVLPNKTFRHNPAVCAPYNSDFDGDEMNLHVLQTEEARAEAKVLMSVQENILSPRFSGPIIGGIHDHITGLFLLTREKKIYKEMAMDLLSAPYQLPSSLGVDEVGEYWTGKQIFSTILPKISMEYKGELCENCVVCKKEECDREAFVKIQYGNLISGTIDEKSIGTFKGKIIEKIISEYGTEEAKKFIDKFTKLACLSIMKKGFSFGISDVYIPSEALFQIEDVIKYVDHRIENLIIDYILYREKDLRDTELINTVWWITNWILTSNIANKIDDPLFRHFASKLSHTLVEKSVDYNNEEVITDMYGLLEAYRRAVLEKEFGKTLRFEVLPGLTIQESLEKRIMQGVGRLRDETGKLASHHFGLDNPAVIMAESGARGSMLNLTQMAGCIGQQTVRGERIKRGYKGRALPHFLQGDLGAEAHGFIKSSYKSGLTPTEYFYHAIGGREGLVDTAARTSQSGYLQRRLINALQDLEAQYDGSVRETRGIIVQFKYGEDGIDPSKGTIDVIEIIRDVISSYRE